MSMQRIAIISAVSSSGLRNRTFYYERHQNGTYSDGGLNFQKNFNLIIGGATLSFVVILICVMCYCFNRTINKNSMALYRQRFMDSMNEQNVDIYTVEQFYDAEPFVPLCTESSIPQGLPPSYESVMAREKAMLEKYAQIYQLKKCCEHINSNIENDVDDKSVNGCDNEIIESEHLDTELDSNGNVNNLSVCSVVDEKNVNESCEHSTSNKCCCDCHMGAVNVEENTIGEASTSTATNHTEHFERNNNNNNNCNCGNKEKHCRTPSEEIDVLSDIGIVRMDMSKIIDRTGLPTYDAALKLESYGYV